MTFKLAAAIEISEITLVAMLKFPRSSALEKFLGTTMVSPGRIS